MNSRVEQSKASSKGAASDIALYVLAILLAAAGVFAYTWFQQWDTSLRIGAVVAGLVAGLVVFMLSAKGRDTREFLSESRFELRKVVWPTRQEATRLTWVVIIVVIIMSLVLAGFDGIIQWLMKLGFATRGT
ncbi:preprotein translocase subunit SecE [Luteimonas panaciterrae]|uniref:preprotein translocase subunit SecE n=1 Tax=Luteimonas panaciterrae TaxID=363885 RepID=UPI001CFA703D|nr:preprotein translocase subunit SecE [Luteimonas panaciterrae]